MKSDSVMSENINNSLVSVILPVYNGEKYIAQSVDSILNQTYNNIELIIIDDGSSDNTLKIINSYLNDPRVIVITRKNKGLVQSLNEAIDISRGKYIARMDADDIAAVDRIEKQIDFLSNNIDVAVVGSRVILINENGDEIGYCYRPLTVDAIKCYFYYGSPLVHPSVVYNLNVLSKDKIKYYKDDYPAEDLGLFLRLSKEFKIRNIKSPLLRYRITSTGISISNNEKQKNKSRDLRVNSFSNNPIELDFVKSIDSHERFIYYWFQLSKSFLRVLYTKGNRSNIIPLFMIYLKVMRRKMIS